MNPDWNAITVLGGLGLLVYYEINRKFPLKPKAGAAAFVERNWPRILFTAVLVPGTGQVLTDWIMKLAN